MTTYRIPNPDGNGMQSVHNVKLYIAVWDVLARKAEAFFPGYKCVGFDPGLHLVKDEPNRFYPDSSQQVDSMRLSTMAAMALMAPAAEPRQEKKFDPDTGPYHDGYDDARNAGILRGKADFNDAAKKIVKP